MLPTAVDRCRSQVPSLQSAGSWIIDCGLRILLFAFSFHCPTLLRQNPSFPEHGHLLGRKAQDLLQHFIGVLTKAWGCALHLTGRVREDPRHSRMLPHANFSMRQLDKETAAVQVGVLG